MAIVKWDPWHEMESLFDRYMKSTGLQRAGLQEPLTAQDWSPKVDIVETESKFEIKAELPEVNREDVHVSIDNGVMTIKGERKQEKEEKGKTFHRIERHFGSFSRSFTLPDNVDQDRIKAAFKDGVMTVELPKNAESKPKSISVSID